MSEFINEYWWCFLVLAVVVLAVVLALVFGAKSNKTDDEKVETSTNLEQKPEQTQDTKRVEAETPAKVEKSTKSEKTLDAKQEKSEKPQTKAVEAKQKAEVKQPQKKEKIEEKPKASKSQSDKSSKIVTEEKPAKVEEKAEVSKKEPANDKVEPASVEAETDADKKEKKQRYFVTYDKDNKDWVVRKTDSERASKRCKTKAEALEVATRLSENQELSLTVKKKDGKFQKKDNYSK